MATRSIIIAGAVAAALISGAARAWEAQEGPDDAVWQQFAAAVDGYVALHHAVERTVPPLEITRDARRIHASLDAMAEGLRLARPSAGEGDIFGEEASILLRQRIRDTLRARGYDPAAMVAAAAEDEEVTAAPRPVVNDRYSWSWPSFAPPALLAVLPHLPKELQYRFVGHDLVLIDVHANLIVDVLRDALPSSE